MTGFRNHWLLSLSLLACGGGDLPGVYEPEGGAGFFESLTFHAGGAVDITFMGMTKEATWSREGSRIAITNAGETQVFTRGEDGCLDGGGFLGTYCKGEGSSAGPKPDTPDLVGVWETSTPEGRMALEFLKGGRLRGVLTEGGRSEREEGTWERSGTTIKVRVPNGEPMELVQAGEVLEASDPSGSFTIRFRRRNP